MGLIVFALNKSDNFVQKTGMELWNEFTPSSIDDWRNKILKDLKIESLERINWTNSIGTIDPIIDQCAEINSVNSSSNLSINADFNLENKFSNKVLLYALKCGVNSISLKGIPSKKSLNGVMHEIISTHIQFSSENFSKEHEFWNKYINQYNGTINGSFRYDPINYFALNGHWLTSKEEQFSSWNKFYQSTQTNSLKSIYIDGSIYGNSLANPVQEVAFTIAHLNEYLNLISSKENLHKIIVKVAVGNSYFIEIAKIRALRKLINAVSNHHNIDVNIQIETTTNKARLSPINKELNLLRLTTFSMVSILGCGDILTINPEAINDSDLLKAIRLATNIPIILNEESHFLKVNDPTRGAYAIEQITSLLKDNSWKLFKEIEECGGWIEFIQTSSPQKSCSKNAENYIDSIIQHNESIVGFNKYSYKNVKLKSVPFTSSAAFNEVNLESIV